MRRGGGTGSGPARTRDAGADDRRVGCDLGGAWGVSFTVSAHAGARAGAVGLYADGGEIAGAVGAGPVVRHPAGVITMGAGRRRWRGFSGASRRLCRGAGGGAVVPGRERTKLNEWLSLMIDEIRRKQSEEEQAERERERRAVADPSPKPDGGGVVSRNDPPGQN